MSGLEGMAEAGKRMTWRQIANHLRRASEELDAAQTAMDDLDVPHISENLRPHSAAVARFQVIAEEKSAA